MKRIFNYSNFSFCDDFQASVKFSTWDYDLLSVITDYSVLKNISYNDYNSDSLILNLIGLYQKSYIQNKSVIVQVNVNKDNIVYNNTFFTNIEVCNIAEDSTITSLKRSLNSVIERIVLVNKAFRTSLALSFTN